MENAQEVKNLQEKLKEKFKDSLRVVHSSDLEESVLLHGVSMFKGIEEIKFFLAVD